MDRRKDGRKERRNDGWKDGQSLFYRTLLTKAKDPTELRDHNFRVTNK